MFLILKLRGNKMAQFRATIKGQRGEASRLGSKQTGINTLTNGWNLGVSVYGFFNDATQRDEFTITVNSGSNGGVSKGLGTYFKNEKGEIVKAK
jgi:hypothetical protein